MGKSLEYVQSVIMGHGIPDIPARCVSNTHQVNADIQEVFDEAYRKIWSEDGLICQPTDTDTGASKKVWIHYDPNADFNIHLTKAGIATVDDIYYIPLMATTFGDIMYSNINDYTKMPEGYDDEDSPVYWEYDIDCVVGDFVFYREENPGYRLLERLPVMEGDTGGLADNRLVTILPMVINYLPVGSIKVKEQIEEVSEIESIKTDVIEESEAT